MTDHVIVEFFANYAYQPYLVYGFIVMFMTASSFGLPIPEDEYRRIADNSSLFLQWVESVLA